MKKYAILFVVAGFFLSAPHAFAAGCAGTGDCYWVGGTGSSNTTTHWATTDGGATTGSVPTATDNCHFTSNSSTANAAYTFTVAATLACKDFVMAGPGSTNKVTWAGGSALNISGNLNLSGGTAGITRTYTGTITMNQVGGTATITSGGITYASSFTFNGSGTTFRLVDDLSTSGTSFTLTAGTFDAGTNSRTVTLTGNTAITTSTSPLTFYNLTVTPAAPTKSDVLALGGGITVSNLFTVSDGATASNRVFVESNLGVGNPVTITASSISISNADFEDITGAGAASWNMSSATGGSGDCGGNTMQALGTSAFTASADQHWTNANGGNWSDATKWTSRVPLCQDNVFLDKAFGSNQTITSDTPHMGKSIDWTGATWTSTLTWTNSTTNAINGSLTLISGLTLSTASSITFIGRGSFVYKSFNISNPTSITINAPGGTLTMKSDFTMGAPSTFTLSSGTLDVQDSGNNWNMNFPGSRFTMSGSGAKTLKMGNGTWTMTSTLPWSISTTNLTFFANSSTIKLNETSNTDISFTGAGLSYNNLYFSRGASTANITITGSNSFNNLRDDGSAAHSILFTAGTTQTISSWSVSGVSTATAITLNSTNTSTFALTQSGTSQLCADYLNIQHSVATGNWYAGSHSVNNQATASAGTGWNFYPCFKTRISGGKTTIRGGKTVLK